MEEHGEGLREGADFFLPTSRALLRGYITVISWIYHGYIMDISWLYHGYIVVISWLYHSYIMVISWLYHGYIMVISWPPVPLPTGGDHEGPPHP